VEWDPTALKSKHESCVICGDCILLQEVIEAEYPTEIQQVLLKAGLKHFPIELGRELLLNFTTDLHLGAAETQKWIGTHVFWQDKWTTIEECLEEVQDLKLQEPNTTTNLYPFMIAASDQSYPCLNLVYYLLKRDPSVMLHFRTSCQERLLECGTYVYQQKKKKI
jgi:hypothetical protein